ncbi:hypothetical protein, partial [Streptomyces sp. b94]|uniref:hypothetical protein n=1 Tax=Streptomyces sp. b94 TaxID=1827634 RepID=UPI00117BF9DB
MERRSDGDGRAAEAVRADRAPCPPMAGSLPRAAVSDASAPAPERAAARWSGRCLLYTSLMA